MKDIEMPEAKFFSSDNIKAAMAIKNITMDEIDDSCHRILRRFARAMPRRRPPLPWPLLLPMNRAASSC